MEQDPELLKKEIEKATEVLRKGGIILYPTDTIWGIGCDATNADAVAKVFEIKNRAESKSLITLVSDADMIGKYVRVFPQVANMLLEVNDKPMTIIYPGATGLASNVIAEDGSVGIRVPQHEFCQRLIKKFGRPIVSTSANMSGDPSPAKFEDVSEKIKESVDYIVNKRYDTDPTHSPSQIIKVGLNGEVKIIR
ncbi:MAG: threonylcarbamoyl-AMP synthase [Bacteroidales bacterium]|jgi:L-threonylcarbamoyladenylate synthase|nr:threonylcarbamoyl-AMP synthase [Bacteroidales bacterium]